MMVFPFRAIDAYIIEPQRMQEWVEGYATPEELEAAGDAITVVANNRPILCAGRVPTPQGWETWTIMAEEAGKHMVRLYKIAKRAMACCDGEIKVYVRNDFRQGHRWAGLFGFKLVEVKPGMMPGGYDAAIYVKEA
jgi:hypothetical protein